jgi:capsular exopolysaccharide synthesis family protein
MPSPDAGTNGANGHPSPRDPVQQGPARAAAKPPAVLSAAPNAVALLKALQRRWLLATFLSVLFAGGTAAAVWFFLPAAKRFAYVQLHVSSRVEKFIGGNQDDPGFALWRETQAMLIKGRLVLNRALNQPKVRDLAIVQNSIDPVEWLEKELKVESPSPEILRITLSGDDPEELKIVVDAVTTAYETTYLEKEREDKNKRLDKLKKRETDLQAELKKILNDINVLGDEGVPGAQDARNQMFLRNVREITLMENKHSTLKLHMSDLVVEEAFFKKADPKAVTDREVNAVVNNHPDLKPLRKEIEPLDEVIKRDMAIIKETNATTLLRDKMSKLDNLQKQLEKKKEELRPTVKRELQEDFAAQAEKRLRQLRLEIESNLASQEHLEKEIEKLIADNKKLVKNEGELGNLEDRKKLNLELLHKVTVEIQNAEADLGNASRVKRLDGEALAPSIPEGPRKIRFAVIAALATLGLVLFGVGFLEFRIRRINSVDEVVNGLGLKLMGTLPAHPTGLGGRTVSPSAAAAAHFQSMLAESVDSARTMLLHAARANSLRIVMVTSSTSGEGKTSLSSHLAVSLARAGRKTLLVDCDLRKPAAHRLFELPLAPGFSEVLRGEIDVEDAIQPTPAAGLSLMAAGQVDTEALQQLAQDGVKRLFAHLRADYDFIIVDSSPVLPVADSLLVAQHVDGVIFSILRDVSRMPKVYAAYQRLATLDVTMLGAVVNGATEEPYGGYGQRYVSAMKN